MLIEINHGNWPPAVPKFLFLKIFLGNEPNSSEFTLSKSYWLVGGAMAIIRGWSHTPETYHNRIVFFTIMVIDQEHF